MNNGHRTPPPEHDAAHPLREAAKSLIVYGILSLLVTPVLGDIVSIRSAAIANGAMLAVAVPGSAMILCGVFLTQRRLWATTMGRVLSVIYGLAALAGMLFALREAITNDTSALVAAGLCVICAWAFVRLWTDLADARKYIESLLPGFDVIVGPKQDRDAGGNPDGKGK